MFQWYNIVVGACNRVSPIEPQELHAGHILYTLRCIRKDLHEKGENLLVLSPFECRTAEIFQVLIPTLNASQSSGGINL